MIYGISIWVYLIVLFLVLEAVSAALISVWFCVGAFAAWITSLMTDSITIQSGVFVVVSLVLLIFTRKIAMSIISNGKGNKTNLELVIGQRAMVLEDIDNQREKGAVKLKGNIWTARSVDDKIIKKDELVTVVRIEGVKVIVSTKKEDK